METFIKQLVRDAGKILRDKFGKVGIHHTKKDALDIVTEADILADKLVTDRIKKKFPLHAIISEESGSHNTNPKQWIIDPMDGTNNFAMGIPFFVTQLAYAENGKLKFAAIYDPIHDKLYFAEKGKGAFVNDKKIHVTTTKDFQFSQGDLAMGISDGGLEILEKINRSIKGRAFWVRNFGSSGVSAGNIASGALDWTIQGFNYVWDYAPLALLVQEAGGVTLTLKGKPWTLKDNNIIAGNPVIVKQLIKILNKK
jgi:myo-inositol-1(or 4)-monophosphatase